MLKHLKFSLLITVFFSLSVQIYAQNQTAKGFFEQGLKFLNEKNFNAALESFRKSAQLEPKEPATQGNIGISLIALNRIAESIAPFREAVRLAPDEPTFHSALCQSLSLTKNHAEAVLQCEEGVRLGGNLPSSHAALIAALRTARRSDEAAQKAELALQKFTDNELLLNAAAEANADTENFSRAAGIYETLARLNPNSAFYQIKLAENYLPLERDAEALAAARKALETEPKHPLAYYFIGKIYFELGQHEEAAKAFQQSIALDGKLSNAFYYLGLSESRRGKSENAITALRQAIALEPENFNYYKELGSMLISASRYEEAITPLKKAAALKPSDFEAKVALGLASFESGHFDEALPVLMEADRIKPGNEVVTMFLSVTRARQQNIARIDEMKIFAKQNPRDINVRVSLMQILTFAQRRAEAESYIAEIYRLKPKDSQVYRLIAVAYATAGNYEKSAEAERKSLEIEQNPGAYLGLASYYAKSGQVEEAIKAYDKVLELKPDVPNIMKLYADFLRDNGRRREALEMYKRSLAMLPANAPALFNAGVLSARLGDLNAARQYLEILKSIDAQSAKLLARCLRLKW